MGNNNIQVKLVNGKFYGKGVVHESDTDLSQLEKKMFTTRSSFITFRGANFEKTLDHSYIEGEVLITNLTYSRLLK